MAIPIIDFSCMLENPSTDARTQLEKDVYEALSSVGFMYLKNHGVDQDMFGEVERVSDELFALPSDVKQTYARADRHSNHGWEARGREWLNPDRPGDMKESFNVTPSVAQIWPDRHVPGFRNTVMTFFQACWDLSMSIMGVMARGLHLQDEKVFSRSHNQDQGINRTTLRLLNYPPVTKEIKPGQIRCGEHSDFGSITLLFQDSVGGLQVYSRSGEWVDATPLPGTVLVNLGDLMQRWTSDRLVSTKHRVLIPEDGRYKTRHSYAFFAHPDDDYVIECVDGSGKYPPVTGRDYINLCLDRAYTY